MTRPAAAARFAVEVFVKQYEVTPVWIVHVFRDLAMTRPRPVLVRQKDAPEPARNLTCYLLKRGHISRAGRALDLERLAIKKVVTFERFDDQEVNRKPDRPPPVRIATEQIAVPLARDVIDPELLVTGAKDVRLLAMHA